MSIRYFYGLLLTIAPYILRNQGAEGHLLQQNDWVYGVDVSHHQRRIEWDSVAGQNVTFAFVKATEGSDFTDSLFAENWEQMKRVGLRRGAYHFFRAYGCGYDQALHFMSQVQHHPGDLPPVLDVETIDGMPEAVLLEEIRAWLQTVEMHLHVKPIIYTNQNFYNRYLAGQFDNHTLWIAKYGEEMPVLTPFRNYEFWQYTNKGLVSGIRRTVDMNVFTGGYAKLCEMCLKAPDSSSTRIQTASTIP